MPALCMYMDKALSVVPSDAIVAMDQGQTLLRWSWLAQAKKIQGHQVYIDPDQSNGGIHKWRLHILKIFLTTMWKDLYEV